MLLKLMRAPIKYFDSTPSGQIVSKFSNDIGLMDYNLVFSLLNFLTGANISLVIFINVFSVNLIYVIPGIITIILISIVFIYLQRPT